MDSPFSARTVVSEDGTSIGYRSSGDGPGVILVPGGMKAAQHLSQLAAALSDDFRVHVIDRRGRGATGPRGSGSPLVEDVADIAALASVTGSRFLFGHSVGALSSLRAARDAPGFQKVVLYEPPLSVDGSAPIGWVERFDHELAEGKVAAALVTALKGARIDRRMAAIPRLVLRPLLALGIRAETVADGDVAIRDLVSTQHADMGIVQEMAETASDYADLSQPVLLLGGTRSPRYLRTAMDELARTLPRAEEIIFPGFDHQGPENEGHPLVVAAQIRRFLRD